MNFLGGGRGLEAKQRATQYYWMCSLFALISILRSCPVKRRFWIRGGGWVVRSLKQTHQIDKWNSLLSYRDEWELRRCSSDFSSLVWAGWKKGIKILELWIVLHWPSDCIHLPLLHLIQLLLAPFRDESFKSIDHLVRPTFPPTINRVSGCFWVAVTLAFKSIFNPTFV